MEFLKFIFLLSFAIISEALTVKEAWENYKNNPLPSETPSWVQKIQSFERFKQRWDEARAFNDKYKTTEEAWKAYKVLFRLGYTGEEDVMRYQIFKKNWEEIIAHNERYARGEVYYPKWTDVLMAETEEERIYREIQPVE